MTLLLQYMKDCNKQCPVHFLRMYANRSNIIYDNGRFKHKPQPNNAIDKHNKNIKPSKI